MTPLILLVTIGLCAVVLFAPRRWALLAIFTSIIYLAQRNGFDLFGLRMYPGRFLEMAGAVRVLSRREFERGEVNQLDKAVFIAYGYVTLMFTLRTLSGFGTSADIKMLTPMSKIGELLDVFLIYITFRGLIKDTADISWVLQRIAPLLLPFVGFLWVERTTGTNPLAILGALPRVWVDADGSRVRCMGSFLHPALLGTFGATIASLYIGLFLSKGQKLTSTIGLSTCLAIIFLANSGGPFTMLLIVLIGWGCWGIRTRMKVLRIGILGALVLLAMVMKAPIWYLPSKMSILFGGSGWHRSYLMQQAINNIDQWWLAGMPLDLTMSWFPYLVLGAADITNLYVAFGVDGGLLAMFLLIWLLITAFSTQGKTLSSIRDARPYVRGEELLAWGVGAALAGHMVNFLSITYFDQTVTLWLFLVSAIAGLSSRIAERAADVVYADEEGPPIGHRSRQRQRASLRSFTKHRSHRRRFF